MEAKIVFTGPPNAGKTTAIASLSDDAPVVTDVSNHDAGLAKARTTVGMDYGVVSLGENEQVRLFGTPGQKRFDFMWQILVRNAIGIVILLDNSQPEALAQLDEFLQALNDPLRTTSCVVGVGRLEAHPEPGIDDYADHLAARGLCFPVIPVDVRRRDDVLMLVELLLSQTEARQVLETQ
ncbi:MAG TPA: GTPase [Burkholderiaceae bacterium]|nr:GTPase [Burkholderiaceae bacterium]